MTLSIFPVTCMPNRGCSRSVGLQPILRLEVGRRSPVLHPKGTRRQDIRRAPIESNAIVCSKVSFDSRLIAELSRQCCDTVERAPVAQRRFLSQSTIQAFGFRGGKDSPLKEFSRRRPLPSLCQPLHFCVDRLPPFFRFPTASDLRIVTCLVRPDESRGRPGDSEEQHSCGDEKEPSARPSVSLPRPASCASACFARSSARGEESPRRTRLHSHLKGTGGRLER